MGSHRRPDAPQLEANVDDRSRTKGENLRCFSDYILELTPPGWGDQRRTPAPLSHDKEERELANVREAMRFFSESNMR
jgi:hypothetical protein